MTDSIKAQIKRLYDWVNTLEERVRLLMDFEIEGMRPVEREAAASKHLMMIGRMLELAQQFEMQLQAGAPTEDEVGTLRAIIFAQAGPVAALPQVHIVEAHQGQDDTA